MSKKSEAVYSKTELMSAAQRFGVKPEVVAGALKLARKDAMTLSEAEKAIQKFMRR